MLWKYVSVKPHSLNTPPPEQGHHLDRVAHLLLVSKA